MELSQPIPFVGTGGVGVGHRTAPATALPGAMPSLGLLAFHTSFPPLRFSAILLARWTCCSLHLSLAANLNPRSMRSFSPFPFFKETDWLAGAPKIPPALASALRALPSLFAIFSLCQYVTVAGGLLGGISSVIKLSDPKILFFFSLLV
jgi:hypothetical protein